MYLIVRRRISFSALESHQKYFLAILRADEKSENTGCQILGTNRGIDEYVKR